MRDKNMVEAIVKSKLAKSLRNVTNFAQLFLINTWQIQL